MKIDNGLENSSRFLNNQRLEDVSFQVLWKSCINAWLSYIINTGI